MRFSSTKEDLDREVEWFEGKLVRFLNNHARVSRITAYLKKWWNEKVAEARKEWQKIREGLVEIKISKMSLNRIGTHITAQSEKQNGSVSKNFYKMKSNKTIVGPP